LLQSRRPLLVDDHGKNATSSFERHDIARFVEVAKAKANGMRLR
jgi:hypothetical protein